MNRSTFAITKVPGTASVTDGVTEVPWPMTGIQGTTPSESPDAGRPVLASVMVYSTLWLPRVGG